MTLDQLTAFANSTDQSQLKVALTKEGARRLLAEIEARDETPEAFSIPTERTDALPYEAMSEARIDRMMEEDGRVML